MPVYDYMCDACGPFVAIETMSRCNEPVDCPDCGVSAPRVLLTAPNISFVGKATRVAHATNEQSADAPKTTKSHGPGCGCCGGSSKKMNSTTLHRPDGSKSFPTKRPWMISH